MYVLLDFSEFDSSSSKIHTFKVGKNIDALWDTENRFIELKFTENDQYEVCLTNGVISKKWIREKNDNDDSVLRISTSFFDENDNITLQINTEQNYIAKSLTLNKSITSA